MRLVPKTWALLAVAALLGAGVVAGRAGPEGPALVEAIPALAPSRVRRIEISSPLEKIRLERVSTDKDSPDFDRWRVVSPIEAAADAAQITALLRVFSGGVAIEAHVDEGNWKDYGLEDQDGRLLELFAEGDVPVVSVVVGKGTVGSTSFIRVPGQQEVLRADVGGRARLDRGAAEWRDRQVLLLDSAQVQRVEITRTRGGAPERVVLARGPSVETDKAGRPLPGPFVLEGGGAGGLVLDAEGMEEVVGTLAKIRAGAYHNPGYDAGMEAPAAEAVLYLGDGTSHRIVLGAKSTAEASFLRVDGREEIVRAAGTVGRALLAPVEEWRDRTIWRLEREDLEGLAFVDGGLTVVLAPQAGTEQWAVAQPANMDADQVAAEQMFGIVRALRAAGSVSGVDFAPTGTRLEARLRDGRRLVLEWGARFKDPAGRPVVPVRLAGQDQVWVLKEAVAAEIRRAFGR